MSGNHLYKFHVLTLSATSVFLYKPQHASTSTTRPPLLPEYLPSAAQRLHQRSPVEFRSLSANLKDVTSVDSKYNYKSYLAQPKKQTPIFAYKSPPRVESETFPLCLCWQCLGRQCPRKVFQPRARLRPRNPASDGGSRSRAGSSYKVLLLKAPRSASTERIS